MIELEIPKFDTAIAGLPDGDNKKGLVGIKLALLLNVPVQHTADQVVLVLNYIIDNGYHQEGKGIGTFYLSLGVSQQIDFLVSIVQKHDIV